MSNEKDPGKANRLNESTYKTKYPYNKAMVTESGMEVHFDDTPGAERIRMSHPDGWFMEVSPGGKKVEMTTGHAQQYHKGGVTMTVDENHDVKVAGHHRLLVGGGRHSEVAGDDESVTGGDSIVIIAGNAKVAVAGDAYMGVKGNYDLNVSGSMNMKVAGTTTMETGGDHIIKAANVRIN